MVKIITFEDVVLYGVTVQAANYPYQDRMFDLDFRGKRPLGYQHSNALDSADVLCTLSDDDMEIVQNIMGKNVSIHIGIT